MKYILIILTFLVLSSCMSSKTYYLSGNAVFNPKEIQVRRPILPPAPPIHLTIFDLHGAVVARYPDIYTAIRLYYSERTPESLPSGIYLSRMTIGKLVLINKKLRIR
ncbi:MAG: hypothetical protein R3C61_11435 [Bacteroidia bacterium]